MKHRRTCLQATKFGLALAMLGLSFGCSDSASGNLEKASTATATLGDLRVTVIEGGDLVSANPTLIRSEVEGRNTIIELVPEGSYVKKGDIVVRMDSSGIEEKLNRQEIELERAADNLTQAEQAVQIQMKKNEEDIGRAQSQLDLARNALAAYKEGTYPLQKAELTSQHTLALERLARAQDEAKASEKLYKDQFISLNELKADNLKLHQAEEEVELAKRRITQLENYTKPEEVRKFESEVRLKKLALMRVQQQTASELRQKENTRAARKRNRVLEQDRRDKLRGELVKCVLKAPSEGLVVYGRESRGRYRGSEPMAVGKDVREREEIIRIPDLDNMVVEVDIHESSVKKIRPGLKVAVRLDALPGEALVGTVISVAPVPSSQSSWLNPNLKVYMTRVQLDRVPKGLKPGMRAEAEILVANLENVLQIPMQGVRSSGKRSFVYLKKGDGVELREVKLGQSNDRMVAIEDGLVKGDVVFLTKPTGAPDLPKPEAEKAPDLGPARPASDFTAQQSGSGHGSASKPGKGRGGMVGAMSKAAKAKWDKMSPEEKKKAMKKWGRRRQDPARDD